MKKSVIYGCLIILILFLGIGFASYYSIQPDDITKFNWTGTTYLAKDKWETISADNNILNVDVTDVTVTNREGNPGPAVVKIIDLAGASLGEEKTISPGETMTFKDIPWDNGTALIQAKATIEGVYEFKVTNQKVID